MAVMAFLLAGCDAETPAWQRVPGGDVEAGRRIVARMDCRACHAIPGAGRPQAEVGPSLAGFGARGYVAGTLPNTPDNLVRWLLDPPSLAPRTAMPELGLEREEAVHVAAFLYTLR